MPNFPEKYKKKYIIVKEEKSIKENIIEIEIQNIKNDFNSKRFHQWMHFSHIAEFWKQTWTHEKTTKYLHEKINSYHDIFWIYINGKAVAYTEIYPIKMDRIKIFCDDQNAWGWHFLIGPKEYSGCGLSYGIAHIILNYVFSHTDTNNIYCEPDHRNKRMINFVKKLSHKQQKTIYLEEKKAILMCCNRVDFLENKKSKITFKPKPGYHYDNV